jgi:hypothetical protein
MPHGIGTGRRRLLVGAATIAGTMIAADALSKTEKAYAVVETALTFREGRKGVNLTGSTYLTTTTTTLDISQGQLGNIQGTPTPDATVVAAQKDKTIQDDIAAQNANNWWRTNLISLLTSLTGVAALVTIAVNVWQYRKNQAAQQVEQKNRELERHKDQIAKQENQQRIDQKEREKRDEDRFQIAVSGLGNEETRIGAAVTLRTFLQECQGYEKFYQQIFDIAVGYLRLRKPDKPEETPDPFNQAIIKLFTASFPLAKDLMKEKCTEEGKKFDPELLDASYLRLDGAYLARAELGEAWLRKASFIGTSLYQADFSKTNLKRANFSEAYLNASRQALRGNDTMGKSMWKIEVKEGTYDISNHLTPIRYSNPSRVASPI